MGAIKLKKIGNSQGVTISKELLEKTGFELGDELEIQTYNGKLIIFKKPLHHSEMSFAGPSELSDEDQAWLNADLGENDQ